MTNVVKLADFRDAEEIEPDNEAATDTPWAEIGYRRHESAPTPLETIGAQEDEWGLDEPIVVPPRPNGWKPPIEPDDDIPWPVDAPWLR